MTTRRTHQQSQKSALPVESALLSSRADTLIHPNVHGGSKGCPKQV